jgi:4-hydroxy-tetrahydrodipicolinate reductase
MELLFVYMPVRRPLSAPQGHPTKDTEPIIAGLPMDPRIAITLPAAHSSQRQQDDKQGALAVISTSIVSLYNDLTFTMKSVYGLALLLSTAAAFCPVHSQKICTAASFTQLAMAADSLCVMVNGMPGPMATAAAEACLRKGLQVCPVAMTGPQIEPCTITVTDIVTSKSASVRLIPSNQRDEIVASLAEIRETKTVIAIDYTHPSAVNDNAVFYVSQQIPFVMGTTGGDRERLVKDCQNHPCVIAPNMGKQIVAMQAALEYLAKSYPGAFGGYKLTVTESHQVTKADTSGTAKAVVASINKLTADDSFTESNIKMIRNEQEALQFGVPETGLKGHAFHTYTITSPDGSVSFQLQHNVAGRTVYAEGTADAVAYLYKHLDKARVYTMIDVLEAGGME